MRWHLFVRRGRDRTNPKGYKLLGRFPSVSLAVREIKQLESLERVLVPLTAFFSADFDEDEEGLSHYRYVAADATYYIRRIPPKPRKGAS